MLDEAIADLRAASGTGRFNLMLEAHTEPAPAAPPLMPAPTLQESIEQLLTAAGLVENAVERSSLLATALSRIDADKEQLPSSWLAATRDSIVERLSGEARIDQSYRVMSSGSLQVAEQRARRADVRGLMLLIERIRLRDRELGGARPEAVGSLLAAVDEKLDAARRLRRARDRYELRLPLLVAYGAAIRHRLRSSRRSDHRLKPLGNCPVRRGWRWKLWTEQRRGWCNWLARLRHPTSWRRPTRCCERRADGVERRADPPPRRWPTTWISPGTLRRLRPVR
jgi:hypothetical protein